MAITTGINTEAEAQTRLQMWLDAEEAISKGQAYAIGDRSLTRADAWFVADRIEYYRRLVAAFQASAAGASQPRLKVATWVG